MTAPTPLVITHPLARWFLRRQRYTAAYAIHRNGVWRSWGWIRQAVVPLRTARRSRRTLRERLVAYRFALADRLQYNHHGTSWFAYLHARQAEFHQWSLARLLFFRFAVWYGCVVEGEVLCALRHPRAYWRLRR